MTGARSKQAAIHRLVEHNSSRPVLSAVFIGLSTILGCGSVDEPPEPHSLTKMSVEALSGLASSELTLHDLEARPVRPLDEGSAAATVFIFTRHDCPISNRYAPEVRRLVEKYRLRDAAFWLVYPDPQTTPENIRAHIEEYDYPCQALTDADHRLVELTGARVTPEVAVFDKRRRLVYCGRIDNRFVDFGQVRPEPTERDLEDVLEAVLTGGNVLRSAVPAVGCPIADLK